jgi:DNA repair exonuclease SbcCD ATPase subunit
MREFEKFANHIPSIEQTIEKFDAMEKESQQLTIDISILENRQREAETILSVTNVEDQGRIDAFEKALVEERADDVKVIRTEINSVRSKVFEMNTLINGIKKLLEQKRQRLTCLQNKFEEKNLLLLQAKIFSLYDRYNELSAQLAAITKEMVITFYKCDKASDVCGVPFAYHIRPNARPVDSCVVSLLPRIVWEQDSNGLAIVDNTEKYFFNITERDAFDE